MTDKQAEIERLTAEQERFADLGKMYSEIRAEAVKEFADKVTYCKDCAKYELMTSNNQHFCNQFGGYVTETDCCSRGVPHKRNGG